MKGPGSVHREILASGRCCSAPPFTWKSSCICTFIQAPHNGRSSSCNCSTRAICWRPLRVTEAPETSTPSLSWSKWTWGRSRTWEPQWACYVPVWLCSFLSAPKCHWLPFSLHCPLWQHNGRRAMQVTWCAARVFNWNLHVSIGSHCSQFNRLNTLCIRRCAVPSLLYLSACLPLLSLPASYLTSS